MYSNDLPAVRTVRLDASGFAEDANPPPQPPIPSDGIAHHTLHSHIAETSHSGGGDGGEGGVGGERKGGVVACSHQNLERAFCEGRMITKKDDISMKCHSFLLTSLSLDLVMIAGKVERCK